MKKNAVLPMEKRLEDGSYLSHIYPSAYDRKMNRKGVAVRVVEYRLEGIPDAEDLYRLITTILDPGRAPAEELAALYHDRWEIETAFGELKTHLRGARIVLRSKTPELVLQEIYGFLMAHFAIRGLMHEAALKEDIDPDRLSFVHAVRVVRRKLPMYVASPPPVDRKAFHDLVLDDLLQDRVVSSRGRKVPRGLKRKMSNYNLRPRAPLATLRIDYESYIRILK